ncbi:MAG: NfeD family protein [Hyphomonadaceae bacterium]
MDALLAFVAAIEPQHWFVLGLILLIAELTTGTTYLLWPAVAAFIAGLIALTGATSGVVDLIIFAVLVIVLTALGRPLVQRFRDTGAADGLNDRAQGLVGARAIVTQFADGAGSVKVQDSVWRAVSAEALAPGDHVEIASAEGTTLTVRRTR